MVNEFKDFKEFKAMGNKYGNRKSGGYDSRKEQKRGADLRYLELAGEISGLDEQVPYELVPAQYAVIDGKRVCVEKAVKYISDFQYVDKGGNLVVEDVKGFRTKDYVIKRKLMLYVHGIKIIEK